MSFITNQNRDRTRRNVAGSEPPGTDRRNCYQTLVGQITDRQIGVSLNGGGKMPAAARTDHLGSPSIDTVACHDHSETERRGRANNGPGIARIRKLPQHHDRRGSSFTVRYCNHRHWTPRAFGVGYPTQGVRIDSDQLGTARVGQTDGFGIIDEREDRQDVRPKAHGVGYEMGAFEQRQARFFAYLGAMKPGRICHAFVA